MTPSSIPSYLTPTQGLATDIAWAEHLFFAPDAPPELVQPHLATLERLTTAPDDWSRLLSLTGLMLLGYGTPERCATRNALLDKGMRQASAFTFPEEVREVTDTAAFQQDFPTLLRLIFLHEPGDPWLQPAWFDPEHPAAHFFCATPREFFARAAAALDPKGTTDLAKWRMQEDHAMDIHPDKQPVTTGHPSALDTPQPCFGDCRGMLTILSDADEHLHDFAADMTEPAMPTGPSQGMLSRWQRQTAAGQMSR